MEGEVQGLKVFNDLQLNPIESNLIHPSKSSCSSCSSCSCSCFPTLTPLSKSSEKKKKKNNSPQDRQQEQDGGFQKGKKRMNDPMTFPQAQCEVQSPISHDIHYVTDRCTPPLNPVSNIAAPRRQVKKKSKVSVSEVHRWQCEVPGHLQ